MSNTNDYFQWVSKELLRVRNTEILHRQLNFQNNFFGFPHLDWIFSTSRMKLNRSTRLEKGTWRTFGLQSSFFPTVCRKFRFVLMQRGSPRMTVSLGDSRNPVKPSCCRQIDQISSNTRCWSMIYNNYKHPVTSESLVAVIVPRASVDQSPILKLLFQHFAFSPNTEDAKLRSTLLF